MKTIAPAAMAAIEAGEAIVTGAVEIVPRQIVYVEYSSEFDYQILPGVLDTSDPESIVPPASGYDSTGPGPFGDTKPAFEPAYPVQTAWPPQTTLWLRRTIDFAGGTISLSGRVENGAAFFIDDELVFDVNLDNSQSSSLSGIAYSADLAVAAGVHTLKILVLDEAENFGSTDNTYFYLRMTGASEGSGEPIRLWGGYGPIDIDGETYQGIGDRGLAQQTSGAIGGFAQGLLLTLSGIEPAALELLDGDEIKGASVVLRRMIFAGDGKTLLDAHIFDRGRVDTVETEEVVGDTATIKVAVETAARGLGRSGARQRSDSDQRLINPSDGYFKHAAYAGEKTLYWGGRKPHRTRSGSSSGSGGFVGGLIGSINR